MVKKKPMVSPALVALVLGLAGSLSLHLPMYRTLGWLSDVFSKQAESDRAQGVAIAPPSTLEWVSLPATQRASTPRANPPVEETLPEAPPKPAAPIVEPVASARAPREPPPSTERQAVELPDSTDREPERAELVANTAHRVEQETVRSDGAREMDESSPPVEPQRGDTREANDRGVDEGREPVEASLPQSGSQGASGGGEPSADRANGEGGGVVYRDPFGTLRIPGGRAGRTGTHGSPGVNVSPSRLGWNSLNQMYGHEQLAEERQAWAASRRSSAGNGGSAQRQEDWKAFRGAIENYVAQVKPGNQTALNTAASPFATYLAQMHRRIHEEFADRFLRLLPADSTSPFSNPSLLTTLEIVLNGDGSLHRVGVVRTSGLMPFDQGAFLAVRRAAPFGVPPGAIRSPDGRVYVHWGFYRNQRQCGTFNARPFLLRGGAPVETGLPSDATPS